ncbi:MAG: hypothetical protein IK066_01520 [Kiritimatiellae bacterium]|nr:hypothetical protein [Kiritimatiellia bacterium]
MKHPLRLLALLPAVLLFAACDDIGSTDSVSGTVSDSSGTIYDFSGTYYSTAGDGGPLVSPSQSGRAITWLRLTQYGSVLEGSDSARQLWRGKISGINSGNASFTLVGATTAGQSVDVVGTLRYGDGSSTIDASWIESSGRSCTLNARAAVSAPTTNTPSASLSVTPSSASIAQGASRTFKATGGAAPYSWSLSSSSYGSLSTSSGASVTFNASTVSGTVTLTVTDTLSSTASATITVN